jgi:ribonuclease HI
MLQIWIDGASKNNGKPHCLSTGGIFTKSGDRSTSIGTVHEVGSTSQRGELHGLIIALIAAREHVKDGETDCRFITDSEYIYNTITKSWYMNWRIKGWITAVGEPVKNKDLWLIIADLLDSAEDYSFFHIKGHVLSIGKVTAATLLIHDPSGKKLYDRLNKIYASAKPERIAEAKEVFLKNHGYNVPTEEVLQELIVGNMVADCIATHHADEKQAQLEVINSGKSIHS